MRVKWKIGDRAYYASPHEKCWIWTYIGPESRTADVGKFVLDSRVDERGILCTRLTAILRNIEANSKAHSAPMLTDTKST